MTLPFTTEAEWEAARQEAQKLLGDQAVKDSLLVLAKSRLLAALAKQVLHRTLREEQASESMYDFILEVASDKAERDGTALDLGDLQESLETFMLTFVKDEISRLESAEKVRDLHRVSLQRDVPCEVGILNRWVTIMPGQLLLVCGAADIVHAQIEAIATSGCNYRYNAESFLAPVDILYLSHSFSRSGDVEARPVYSSLSHWKGRAKTLSRWRKFLSKQSKKFFTVVSNLALAGGDLLDKPGFKPQDAALVGITTLSGHLTNAIERTVAGLYVPRDGGDDFSAAVEARVRELHNVTLVSV